MPNKNSTTPIDSRMPRPLDKGDGSLLKKETALMAFQQRQEEKAGLRRILGLRVQEGHEPPDESLSAGDSLDAGLEEKMLQHPLLDGQRFDGDLPLINTPARREFDNKRREQQAELQHRLGLAPSPSFSPKPRPA